MTESTSWDLDLIARSFHSSGFSGENDADEEMQRVLSDEIESRSLEEQHQNESLKKHEPELCEEKTIASGNGAFDSLSEDMVSRQGSSSEDMVSRQGSSSEGVVSRQCSSDDVVSRQGSSNDGVASRQANPDDKAVEIMDKINSGRLSDSNWVASSDGLVLRQDHSENHRAEIIDMEHSGRPEDNSWDAPSLRQDHPEDKEYEIMDVDQSRRPVDNSWDVSSDSVVLIQDQQEDKSGVTDTGPSEWGVCSSWNDVGNEGSGWDMDDQTDSIAPSTSNWDHIVDGADQVDLGYFDQDLVILGKSMTVRVAYTANGVEDWINKYTAEERHFGIDIEWRPNHSKGDDNKAAIFQIAGVHGCLIVQLFYMDWIPNALKELLADPEVKLAGVGVKADFKKLFHDYGLTCQGAVDLGIYAADILNRKDFRRAGLATLCNQVLEIPFKKNKAMTVSNWSVEGLSLLQIIYAASDACIAYCVLVKLNEISKEHSTASTSSEPENSDVESKQHSGHENSNVKSNQHSAATTPAASELLDFEDSSASSPRLSEPVNLIVDLKGHSSASSPPSSSEIVNLDVKSKELSSTISPTSVLDQVKDMTL